jgi:penicillin-binding protein 2
VAEYSSVTAPEKIALALIVENGGWGAQAAGPIARAAFDYYLMQPHEPRPAAPQAEPSSKNKEAVPTSVADNDTVGRNNAGDKSSAE